MIYDFYHGAEWVDSCPTEQVAMLTAILTALYGDIRMVVRCKREAAPAVDFWEWLEAI